MKLWNKEDNLNIKIEKFTVGNDRHYDLYLAEYDIRATIAHAKMLHNIKIITHSELAEIISELKKLIVILKPDNLQLKTIMRIFIQK